MPTDIALSIVRAAHGLETPPDLERLEKYINDEMPGEYKAQLFIVNCGPSRGKEFTVHNTSGEIVHRYYSCSRDANLLSTVKWIAGRLDGGSKGEVGKAQTSAEIRKDPLQVLVEKRIRTAANNSGDLPGLRTMADFIDDHLVGCRTELVKGTCGNGSFYLNVLKGDQVVFEFTTCLPGSDLRLLAQWIIRILDGHQS